MNRPLVAAAAALLAAACAGPKFYGVKYALDAKRVFTADMPAPSEGAREVVKKATTIAFFPPDACRDVKAAGAGTEEVSNVLRLSCGVLMSELEAESSRQGFSVVSWQTLRGGTGRVIDYARENKVDILFEINELSLDIPPQDLYSFSDMTFFQRDPTSPVKTPLVVQDTMATAKRCQDRYWEQAGATLAVTLDVKMVSVEDGRVRWAYRDTVRDKSDEKVELVRTYEVQPGESSAASTFWILGGTGLSIGLTLLLLTVVSSDVDVQKVTTPAAVVSAGGAGALLLGMILDSTTREYPPPDDVLCQPGWRSLEEQPKVTVKQATAGSSVSFTEARKLAGSDTEARRKQLLKQVIQEFTSAFAAMKN
jgi:hypothetical protein